VLGRADAQPLFDRRVKVADRDAAHVGASICRPSLESLIALMSNLTGVAESVISSVTGGFELNDPRIEGSQSPNRQGADPLTIPEIMAHYRIPSVSMAVIHDLAVHWAKSWGVADVESSARVINERCIRLHRSASRLRLSHRSKPSRTASLAWIRTSTPS
jgi:hypothetical protein